MMMRSVNPFVALLALITSVVPIHAGESKPIQLSTIGSLASSQSVDSGLEVASTPAGVRLGTRFQKLAGTVTESGLELESTEAEGGALRLKASALGRVKSMQVEKLERLPETGVAGAKGRIAWWSRAGVREEYSVSMDGVRQDFVVASAPAGEGNLCVELSVSGARAEVGLGGIKLTLAGSGRELAYTRLHVSDATGRELRARLEAPAADRLRVIVEDAGAVYPVRVDPTFSDADWVNLNSGILGANDAVFAVAFDASGNLYIGGSFTFAGSTAAKRIAKWDGSTWTEVGGGTDGTVYALAFMGDDLYVGGYFVRANESPVGRLAKWDGVAWSDLGGGVTGEIGSGFGEVRAMAVKGTDLYVGGSFAGAGGVTVNGIAKWNGTTWSALGTGLGIVPGTRVNAMTFIGDDLYVGGSFRGVGGAGGTGRVAKWDGSQWSGLGSGFGVNSSAVNALAVKGGDLYAGGSSFRVGTSRNIAKWNGTEWSGLTVGAGGESNAVHALGVVGTDLYVGGNFMAAGEPVAPGRPPKPGGGAVSRCLAKWDGTTWSDVSFGLNDPVHVLAARGDDLYVGGRFTTAGDTSASGIVKFDGTDWSAFGDPNALDGSVMAVATAGPDLYIGGTFTRIGGVSARRVAKWNGSAWTALGSGISASTRYGNPHVKALAVIGSDLYVAGQFANAGDTPGANHVAKWDGTEWSALATGPNARVEALAVIGTDLYVGGAFDFIDEQEITAIAKWNGTAWSKLGAGVSFPAEPSLANVQALAVKDSTLYVGGDFTKAGSATAYFIAQWNGSTWRSLGGGVESTVRAIAVVGDFVYIGGEFETAGPVEAKYIARWNGSAWSAVGGGVDSSVTALAANAYGLFVGGGFDVAGEIEARRIARWDGSSWSALGAGINAGLSRGGVHSLHFISEKHLLVGGEFVTVGTKVSPFFAEADLSALPPPLFAGETTPPIGGPIPGTNSTLVSVAAPTVGAFAGVLQTGRKKEKAIFGPDGSVLLKVGTDGVKDLGKPSGDVVTAKVTKGPVAAVGRAGARAATVTTTQLFTGLLSGTLQVGAETNTVLDGLPEGVTIKKFLAIDGHGATPFALVTLQGTGVTMFNDSAVIAVRGERTVNIVVREDQTVTNSGIADTIKTITTLVGSKGTLAANRWRLDANTIGVRVTFRAGGQAVYSVPASATSPADLALRVQTGAVTGGELDGTTISSFGLPGFSSLHSAQLVNLAKQTGITAANNAAITSGENVLARKGDEARDADGNTMTGVIFKTLADPICGKGVAFAGTLAGTGVTGSNKAGLWYAADGITPKLLARAGDPAPGGGRWKSFSTMVLPDAPTRGPIFIGTLIVSRADGVTKTNNLGIWALDSTGTLQLMLRTGALPEGKTLRTFSALVPTPAIGGTASGYNNQGEIAALLTPTKGAKQLHVLKVP